ncbi:AraC family ligand binding domain-containing protein [Microbacterium sp. P06]|uniref:AraC family transcriptional regulator n=1 Tax=Microbacterium sp. P06 TaxID=3366949 RepID=UPI0037475249
MADAVRAWRSGIPGVREVLHATFREHAYPSHTHDAWTVLLIDTGAVRYRLDGSAHIAAPGTLTLLPPHVAHDGRTAEPGREFRKRVLYLDAEWLPAAAVTAAAQRPTIVRRDAAAAARAAHAATTHPGDELAGESAVVALRETVRDHLDGERAPVPNDDPLARRLRALLDDRLTQTFTLAQAGSVLGAHPAHLIRSFSRAYGIAPHRYVTGRRVDLARRWMLAGTAPAEAAALAGFYDQAHLARHFRRVLGATPAVFVAAARRDSALS